MHFGENQLSLGSIGISPLPTTHPSILQHGSVRPSSACYRAFRLVMGSSPSFGSAPSDWHALFGLAFAAAPGMAPLASPLRSNSPARSTKSTPSPARAGSDRV
jgi:hypothetical protein